MATPSVTSVVMSTITATTSAATATSTKVPPQGGILEGALPNAYSAKDPLKLFIIQAGIIIILCRLLHYPLSRLGQPRVIAEVIGGIVLGPSVLARIPGFADAIFPTASLPVLTNVANLGLILFLFLIALELDVRLFTANWRIALAVGLAGMVVPFSLGVAVAYGLFHQFASDYEVPIDFGVFALFIGTALAITAFPVLCRILSELNLLGTSVGVTVLAAGIGNDVTGWILLALCVALVNNGSGLAALWVLLACLGWILFLFFAVKPAFHWCLRRSGSLQNGPTQGMVALTILIVLTSAWFTDIIGVHPIFGGFLAGLICPHEGGFAVKLTEKIEDLITVLFLPLYFALSGLSTNLGLLNDGITWAYVIAIIVIAFAGKIIGGTLAARSMRLVWRESLTIGALMSCKGLVELIVLNIGLQAKLLSQRTFTMFVVMALVTTVATTPMVKGLYPPWYHKKLTAWKRGEIDWDGNPLEGASQPDKTKDLPDAKVRRLLVYLRLDSLPSIFTFISLLGEETTVVEESSDWDTKVAPKRPLEVHALRILELTERTSSVMRVTETDELTRKDPVVNAFRTFSQLHDVATTGSVVVAPEDAYAQTVVSQAAEMGSDFVLIPWSEGGSNTVDASTPHSVSAEDRFSGRAHLDFIQNALEKAVCNTGIFIGNGFSNAEAAGALSRSASHASLRRETALFPIADKTHHVFLPFIGGVDDRVALRFVLQLARNPHVRVTVAHLSWGDDADDDDVSDDDGIVAAVVPDSPDSSDMPCHKGGGGAAARARADMTSRDAAALASLQASATDGEAAGLAGRVALLVVPVDTSTVLARAVDAAQQHARGNAGDMVVVGRRHARLASRLSASSTSLSADGRDLGGAIGPVGEKMATAGLRASVLVVQAGGGGLEL